MERLGLWQGVLPVLLLFLLSVAVISDRIMCPLCTRQLHAVCCFLPTAAKGKTLRYFLLCLYKTVRVSEGEGDYSEAVTVSLAQLLAQAEKLP